jgi:hypothetical protein
MKMDSKSLIKKPAVLLASVALNIFLVAFTLGRCSDHMMHPPFTEGHGPRGFGGPHGNMPPPPFFGPDALFTHEEMEQNFAAMKENFERGDKLRADFAGQLKKGPVTKDAVLKHFSNINTLMEADKIRMQDKAAEKISIMTDQQRAEFAEQLLGKEF